MNEVPPTAHMLARRLVAQEPGLAQDAESGSAPALRAVDRLRIPLSKLSGVEGYRILLLRALTLAKARAPSLSTLAPAPDGTLVAPGPAQSGRDGHEPSEGTEDGIILLSELLGLLILFIGEALTLQLLRSVWPDADLDHKNTKHKETLR